MADSPATSQGSSLRRLVPRIFSRAPRVNDLDNLIRTVRANHPKGDLPIPMPVTMVGTFEDDFLSLSASSDMVDAGVEFRLEGGVPGFDITEGGIGAAVPSGSEPVCRDIPEDGK